MLLESRQRCSVEFYAMPLQPTWPTRSLNETLRCGSKHTYVHPHYMLLYTLRKDVHKSNYRLVGVSLRDTMNDTHALLKASQSHELCNGVVSTKQINDIISFSFLFTWCGHELSLVSSSQLLSELIRYKK